MGNGESKGEGSAYITDMHAYPHLREAIDRARRTNLERSADSADRSGQHAQASPSLVSTSASQLCPPEAPCPVAR